MVRKYGTDFFEEYAAVSLRTLLGPGYDGLENRDRPDLQSPDGRTLGIEVTRAMESSKRAADAFLKEMSGIVPRTDGQSDLEQMLRTGYGYGLGDGQYIGEKEREYWAMALPLQRIIDSKVSKANRGLYGHFDRLGLYIFCKDPLNDAQVVKTYRYLMALQRYNDIRYERLFLSEICSLYVCDLREGVPRFTRMLRYPITTEQRHDFYTAALHYQLNTTP